MHHLLSGFASWCFASVLNYSIRKSTQPRRLRSFSLALKTALHPWYASSFRTGVPQELAFVYTSLCFHSDAGHFCLHCLSRYFVLFLSIKDLNHISQIDYTITDGYDYAQLVICFLYQFKGMFVADIYGKDKYGKHITIKTACYRAVDSELMNFRRKIAHNRQLEFNHNKHDIPDSATASKIKPRIMQKQTLLLKSCTWPSKSSIHSTAVWTKWNAPKLPPNSESQYTE